MEKLLISDWMTSPSVQFVAKITSSGDMSWHDHNFFEIFYILEGSITHHCNGVKEKLEANDVRLLRPLQDKHEFLRENAVSCMHRDIIISEHLFKKCCDFIDPLLFDKIKSFSSPLKAKLSQSKLIEFEKIISEMFFMPTEKSIYTKDAASNVLVIDLLRVFLEEFQSNPNTLPTWLQAIIPLFSTPTLMRKGLDSILEGINYDKSHICRTFKKHIGVTMTEYLRDKRLDYAASLLLTTDKTVSQICEEVGFDSIPYFTNAFKAKYKLSPKQFKLKFK